MVRAKRRDEWDRWSQLLALVDNRTNFAKGAKPVQAIDLFPPGLITAADRLAMKLATKRAKAPTIMLTGKDLQALAGVQ